VKNGVYHRYTFYLYLFMDIRNSAIHRHTFYMDLLLDFL
jgi:hypothetical protein